MRTVTATADHSGARYTAPPSGIDPVHAQGQGSPRVVSPSSNAPYTPGDMLFPGAGPPTGLRKIEDGGQDLSRARPSARVRPAGSTTRPRPAPFATSARFVFPRRSLAAVRDLPRTGVIALR